MSLRGAELHCHPRESGDPGLISKKVKIVKSYKKIMYLYFVYILANQRNGALYIGVTSNLLERADQHKKGVYDSFTKRYNINKLVYYKTFENINDAIAREKQ